MDITIIGLLITQGLVVIAAMFKAWFAFGKLVQRLDDMDYRLVRIENHINNKGG